MAKTREFLGPPGSSPPEPNGNIFADDDPVTSQSLQSEWISVGRTEQGEVYTTRGKNIVIIRDGRVVKIIPFDD